MKNFAAFVEKKACRAGWLQQLRKTSFERKGEICSEPCTGHTLDDAIMWVKGATIPMVPKKRKIR